MIDADSEACNVLDAADGRRTEDDDEDSSNGTCVQRLKRRKIEVYGHSQAR